LTVQTFDVFDRGRKSPGAKPPTLLRAFIGTAEAVPFQRIGRISQQRISRISQQRNGRISEQRLETSDLGRVEAMSDLPEAIDRLTKRLEALEGRVHALEHAPAARSPLPAQKLAALAAAEAGAAHHAALAGGAFPVLGKAMLGIAGAYLLRAVEESASLPRQAVAAVAIAYAILWLAGAARTGGRAWFARTAYACTSALILAPMLWELTLRFKVLPPAAAACALGAFAGAAFALSWRRNLDSILWIANGTAAAVAVTLAIGSHQMTPFIAVLLGMVLLGECAAARSRESSVRALVAAAADLSVWAQIYIYSSPQSTRGDYPALGAATLLAPGLILFVLYAASVTFRTAWKGIKITLFETIQIMIAFLLAASGLLYFGPPGSATVLGIFCFVFSAASYAAAFVLFDRGPEPRNYQVFAAWSAALYLAGSLLCLPPFWMAASLGAAAIAAALVGDRLNRPALLFHAAAYLLAAAAVSGLLDDIFRALAGSFSAAFAPGAWLVAACAALCYAGAKPRPGESWKRKVVPLVSASLTVGAAAALLVQGLMKVTAMSVTPGAHHLAFIRTLTLCAAALALAFCGAHWRRMELTRIGYAALALVAVKLVLEDLRLGHLAFIAASIFLFAITLIAVPRVARMRRKG
jgi:hypothetical protein